MRVPGTVAGIAVVVAAMVFGACSSSAKPSSTSPTTVHKFPTALSEFFKDPEGSKVLQIERISNGIADGKRKSVPECHAYEKALQKVADANYIFYVVSKIPNAEVSRAFHDDIAMKNLFLASCDTGKLAPLAPPKTKAQNDKMLAVLAKYDIRF